jgi:TonB family protein
MVSDRVFQFTLLISAALHLAVLLQNNYLSHPTRPNNKKKDDLLEINYLQKVFEKDITQAKDPGLKLGIVPSVTSRIAAAKKAPPPFIDRRGILKEKNSPLLTRKSLFAPSVLKKPEIKPDIIAVKKKISLPHVDIDKISNPSYLSYYQIIREKIRRCAYRNYATSNTGEVYISFIVSSAGYLEEARLVEEKSSADVYLTEIALKSVNDASPFPKFPTELDYFQLSFNVIISFEIE